jgi:hypothetical protein
MAPTSCRPVRPGRDPVAARAAAQGPDRVVAQAAVQVAAQAAARDRDPADRSWQGRKWHCQHDRTPINIAL